MLVCVRIQRRYASCFMENLKIWVSIRHGPSEMYRAGSESASGTGKHFVLMRFLQLTKNRNC